MSLSEIRLIIAKEIITVTTTDPCEMSGPSSKFFSVAASCHMSHCSGPVCLLRTIRGQGGAIPPSQPSSPLSRQCSIVVLVTFQAT